MRSKKKTDENPRIVRHPSPFRYPGGKGWLTPYVRQWLASLPKPLRFVEPFAGGANVGLTVAMEGLAGSVTLLELDQDIAAVWETILSERANTLTRRIRNFKLSKSSVKKLLTTTPRTQVGRAFATLVKNRVRRAGILVDTANLLRKGEDGKGIRSRWYPETLSTRIKAISKQQARVTFLHHDAYDYIRANITDPACAFFVDPPYTLAGRRLYRHSEIDHRALFELIAEVRGFALLTYDDTSVVRKLASEFNFQIERVKMRTAHHSVKHELLISKDLSWLE